MNTRITTQMIAKEALRLLADRLTHPDLVLHEPGVREWALPIMVHSEELYGSLDSFSEKYIIPAMEKTAEKIIFDCQKSTEHGFTPRALEPVVGFKGAVEIYSNICLRATESYVGEKDKTVYRFDVVLLGPIPRRKLTMEDRVKKLETDMLVVKAKMEIVFNSLKGGEKE